MKYLSLVSELSLVAFSAAFSPTEQQSRTMSQLYANRSRSRVKDPAGPTPVADEEDLDEINLEDVKEFKYDPDNHPIPHQPWRRGETAGCEDPIDADWRKRQVLE